MGWGVDRASKFKAGTRSTVRRTHLSKNVKR